MHGQGRVTLTYILQQHGHRREHALAQDCYTLQAFCATILKAHMTALKKRERKDRKMAAEGGKKEEGLKKSKKA
ncbi:hypothetical protein DKX38_021379 [Salix brachista]|uniref:Uncharacterized protein n=1 Tax=Salix brachista TaxID=2182728 RepID=A0A5N5K8B5_9ROSI|nr:hypothetical protein DKX38_021379 [Salix brachista]